MSKTRAKYTGRKCTVHLPSKPLHDIAAWNAEADASRDAKRAAMNAMPGVGLMGISIGSILRHGFRRQRAASKSE